MLKPTNWLQPDWRRTAVRFLLVSIFAFFQPHCFAQQVTIPFLAANFSYLDPFFSNAPPLIPGARALTFSSPGQGLENDTNYFSSTISEGAGFTVLDWPPSMDTEDSRPAAEPYEDPILAGVYASVNVEVDLYQEGAGATLDEALTNNLTLPLSSYTISDVTVQFSIQGGEFAGSTVNLPAKVAYASSTSSYGLTGFANGVEDTAEGDLMLVIDWGDDPSGSFDCLVVDFFSQGNVFSQDTTILPIGTVLSDLSVSTPADSVNSINSAILSQITSGALSLSGAIPELLYLYDFSALNTLPVWDTVPLDGQSPDTNGSYSNAYKYINQYDAGVIFNLPTRFGPPIPSPSYSPGGNACGPTSLGMAIAFYGSQAAPAAIYDNTMQFGFVSTENFANAFNWIRAKNWLDGATYNALPFSSASPLIPGTTSYFLGDTNQSRFAADWSQIDGVLTNLFQPVLLRTDLGFGSGLTAATIGGGHVILLLGRAHSDLMASLYGLSGDYYIVADPAGHFFADISSVNGPHYNRVQNLMTNLTGVNYGGWAAAYPVELLQESIVNKATGQPEIRALTFPSPFPVAQAQAQCPVSLIVTDPLGRQTGIQPNGTVVENIPQSWYQPEVADEEEDGNTVYLTNGVKTVVVLNPMAGTNHIQLIGTGSGSYALSWLDVGADGEAIASTNFSGTTTLGEQTNYTIAPLTSQSTPPLLQFAREGNTIILFWPVSATSFQLQATTNLNLANSWTAVTNPVSTLDGLNIVTTLIYTSFPQFFRLQN